MNRSQFEQPATDGPRFPEIEVSLIGEDGNIFNLLSIVKSALQRHGVDRREVRNMIAEVFAARSYDAALRILGSWVVIS